MQLGTDAGRRAWPPAGWTAQNAEERADRQGPAYVKPGIELLPRPAVHPDLPPATTLPSTDQDGAALAVKIGLSQRQRLADPKPGTPEHDDHPAQPHRLRSVPRGSHHGDHLLHGWRVWRIAKPLVARHAALVKPGQGRLRPAAPGTIRQSHRFHDVLLWTTVDPSILPRRDGRVRPDCAHRPLLQLLATRHRPCANEPTPRGRRCIAPFRTSQKSKQSCARCTGAAQTESATRQRAEARRRARGGC